MNVRCYVPTHSLVNYSAWHIVSPEASLASLPCVDGYIAKVWTGTSRQKNFFNGVEKERVFENAFLEYGSMESMTAPTGRKMFFLTDPIEDRPRDWADYKRNYEATFTAQLLYPKIANYEIMPWQEMMPEIANHIKADGFSFYIFSGILYLIIGFGLFGTILMMTVERMYEFGMLIAIGMKKSKLKIILLGETFLITLLGVVLGMLLSMPSVIYLQEKPIRFSGEIAKAYEQFGFEALFPAEFDLNIFFTQSLIVLFMAILIGLYPLWFVSGLNPVNAMKK
jgi:ABC-type antimicrobial peptide transport system permease subunit